MNYNELLQKYNELVSENTRLQSEINRLQNLIAPKGQNQIIAIPDNLPGEFNKFSRADEKIELYMSIFKGRTDVYAKRWENKVGKSGYSPVCLNEWKNNVCSKPQGKCNNCNSKLYPQVDKGIVEDHLTGKIVVGIYPMLPDETCWFLAIDFDGSEWKKDVTAVRQSCIDLSVPVAIERSRSGNGAHAWFFFQEPVSAVIARKFGTKLLTYTMSRRHEIKFASYDRLFPNQDTMPRGGFGNLIALPFQKEARKLDNSVFVDTDFVAYSDQWLHLSSIRKLTSDDVEATISRIKIPDELGNLHNEDDPTTKPWEPVKRSSVTKSDFPQNMIIVESDMLYIVKSGISQNALNTLKRLAAFKNSDFFKTQAMRLSTYGKPRIISCSEETEQYVCLPRGCREDLIALLSGLNVKYLFDDQTQHGNAIYVTFNGVLRDEQTTALNLLLAQNTGVLCGTTAFGKTVVAIKLISELKVNTLIIVDKVSLLSQWKNKLEQFLTFNNELQNSQTNKNQSIKSATPVGVFGAGKKSTTGIIDIALVQSLARLEDLKEFLNPYGMIIVDECHHVSSVSFENVLKKAPARYVYGLTATPQRKDGHHPIIFMQCGNIRFRDDAKQQAANRPFDHVIVPRFTRMVLSLEHQSNNISISTIYSDIIIDEFRNQVIADDVISCFKEGRNCCIISERTAHIEMLIRKLQPEITDIITLTGQLKSSELKTALKNVENQPIEKPITLIATGKFIGEGFDIPRLDTLFF